MHKTSHEEPVGAFLADLRSVGVTPPAEDKVVWFVNLHAKSASLQHVLLRLGQQGKSWGVAFKFTGERRLDDVRGVCEQHGFSTADAAIFADNILSAQA